MNKAILCILFLLAFQLIFAQGSITKIDSLNSENNVEKLIRSFGKEYNRFIIKPITGFENSGDFGFCKRIADSLNITKSYYKADFDNNGYTDLMVIGDYYDFSIFVVMNFGNGALKLNRLTRRAFQECAFPLILNDTIIRYYYNQEPNWTDKGKIFPLLFKDLSYKFGDFIEHNPEPKIYSIEKIEYQTTYCFGVCPKFSISIAADKSAIFKAEDFNRQIGKSKEIKGTFTATIKDSSFSEIINLLNYLDFPELENSYSVGWTDDQSCTLTITYNNGKVKTINDYGLIGTYGLNRLHQLLFNLRFNQDWR